MHVAFRDCVKSSTPGGQIFSKNHSRANEGFPNGNVPYPKRLFGDGIGMVSLKYFCLLVIKIFDVFLKILHRTF